MKNYDEELLAASGSKEQYEIDVKNLGDRLRQEVERLKATPAGRARLRKAGFEVPKAMDSINHAEASAAKVTAASSPKGRKKN